MIINKMATGTLTALTLLAAALPASAQNSMSGDHMMGHEMSGPANAATYVCRAANAGEKPTAMMGTSSLVCKPVAVEMKMSDGKTHMMGNPKATAVKTPDSAGLTSAQLNDAYAKWLGEVFSVNVQGGN